MHESSGVDASGVRFTAAEIKQLESDFTALRDIRGMVRTACLYFDRVSGERKKMSVLMWLSDKNQQAHMQRERNMEELKLKYQDSADLRPAHQRYVSP